mmetsp:Transcript_21160/g.65609  ORF Transcript_21160/g.65609 Transcript_21160/m.65609 type:complete len:288 (-) Transcript_21160:584-1447(-)
MTARSSPIPTINQSGSWTNRSFLPRHSSSATETRSCDHRMQDLSPSCLPRVFFVYISFSASYSMSTSGSLYPDSSLLKSSVLLGTSWMSCSQSGMPLPDARTRPSRRSTRKMSSPVPTPSTLLCISSMVRSHSASAAAGGSALKRLPAACFVLRVAAATAASNDSSSPPSAFPPSRVALFGVGVTAILRALEPKPLLSSSFCAAELPMMKGTSSRPRSSSWLRYFCALRTAAPTFSAEPASTTGRALERRSQSCTCLVPPMEMGRRLSVSSMVSVLISCASPSWSRR